MRQTTTLSGKPHAEEDETPQEKFNGAAKQRRPEGNLPAVYRDICVFLKTK